MQFYFIVYFRQQNIKMFILKGGIGMTEMTATVIITLFGIGCITTFGIYIIRAILKTINREK